MLDIQNIVTLPIFGAYGWGYLTLQSNEGAYHFCIACSGCTEKLIVPGAVRQTGRPELNGAQRTPEVGLQNEETDAWWLGLAKNFPSSLFSSNGKLEI